jgi:hypothetical protein
MATSSRVLEGRGGPAAAVRVAAAVVYAWVAGSFERFTWPATLAVLLPGALALAAAARRRPPRPVDAAARRVDPRGAALWLAVFLGFCLWELVTFLQQPSPTAASWDHPTLSTLADPVLASHPARSLALLAWLGLGRALLRR